MWPRSGRYSGRFVPPDWYSVRAVSVCTPYHAMSNLSSAASWNHPVFAPPPLYPYPSTAAPVAVGSTPVPPVYTRVSAGAPGAKASLHAVLDYDYDDYYEDEDIPKGPVATKNNGTLPVVPLYSFQTLSNGTIIQVPILWTALSLALGLEIRGDVIRGTPCIKKHHQLFCPTAGNTYPLERIEMFIDENKALIKRMYGEFQDTNEYGPPGREPVVTEAPPPPPPPPPPRDHGHHGHHGHGHGPSRGRATSYVSLSARARRQALNDTNTSDTGRVDACLSKVEIVTPYWAANSAGKVRAIVNTQHFEQAIHQEVCSKGDTPRCRNDCGCEQKYKWHRLLAYDPDNDCKGIFMDWFLFPSCCVCRCQPFGK